MHPQAEPVHDPSSERRLALVHRVLVPGEDHPTEYAILLTEMRSIFIRQPKTRSGLVLRGEMRFGTALVTDFVPKTLEDYRGAELGTLSAIEGNFEVLHESVVSLVMGRDAMEFRLRDLFVWLTMKRQDEVFQVYNFRLDWQTTAGAPAGTAFYAVPLGQYVKPRRQTQGRETILREYALNVLEAFERVLPEGAVRARGPSAIRRGP